LFSGFSNFRAVLHPRGSQFDFLTIFPRREIVHGRFTSLMPLLDLHKAR